MLISITSWYLLRCSLAKVKKENYIFQITEWRIKWFYSSCLTLNFCFIKNGIIEHFYRISFSLLLWPNLSRFVCLFLIKTRQLLYLTLARAFFRKQVFSHHRHNTVWTRTASWGRQLVSRTPWTPFEYPV